MRRSESSTLLYILCSPDEMMKEVATCPNVRTLMDLKDCLDFCSTSWVQLFCRLGGAALLLQVAVCLQCCSVLAKVHSIEAYRSRQTHHVLPV